MAKQPQVYQIQVLGKLDARWSEWFSGLQIASVEDASDDMPVTTLRGPVRDQVALRGMVNKLWDLNLVLLSLQCLEEKCKPEAARHGEAAPEG